MPGDTLPKVTSNISIITQSTLKDSFNPSISSWSSNSSINRQNFVTLFVDWLFSNWVLSTILGIFMAHLVVKFFKNLKIFRFQFIVALW